MPGYDGTGPRGQGPMTGGGRGYCVTTDPGYGLRPLMGMGFGRGRGRGFRNRFYATGLPGWQRAAYGYPAYRGGAYAPEDLTAEQEREMLKSEAEMLRNDLKNIQDRIESLEKENK